MARLSECFERVRLVPARLAVAELISGAREQQKLALIASMLEDFPVHETPLEHWLAVGHLRRRLRELGVAVSISDAHVAQCALDLDALLLTRD